METYSAANMQEIIDKSLQDYVIERMPPPSPINQENIDSNIQQNGASNSITATNLQVMFKTYMEFPKKSNNGGSHFYSSTSSYTYIQFSSSLAVSSK